MGYRSDVMFAFYPKSGHDELFPAIKLWVEENWPKDEEFCTFGTKGNMVLVKYDAVKWYANFDKKKAWDATTLFEGNFDTEDYEQHRAHWEFVRVGEDLVDIEQGGSSYHDYRLGVSRTIEVD